MLGHVWDLDLPANKLLVLLALADHADHNGENAYPSADLIAWKTGYSERQVRRILQSLVKDEILSHQPRPGKTSVYSIHLDNGKKKPAYTKKGGQNDIGQNVTPDKMSVVKPTYPGHLDVLPTPDTQMSDEPSFNQLKDSTHSDSSMSEAIREIWHFTANRNKNFSAMLQGVSTIKGLREYNLRTPVTADELIRWAAWYRATELKGNAELNMVEQPIKIQSSITYWQEQGKPDAPITSLKPSQFKSALDGVRLVS